MFSLKKEILFVIAYFIAIMCVLTCFRLSYTSGGSMLPTIKNGEVLIINKFIEPKHMDIVNIYSEEVNKDLCKRVIGLEGDTVEIIDGIVSVNGEVLDEPYNEDTTTNMKCIVGDGEVFVLGDNRNNSTDSRLLGTLNIKDIVGVCVLQTHLNQTSFTFIVCLFLALFGFYAIKSDTLKN